VVKMARPLGVTVEGELGLVGRVDQISTEGGEESTLTDPAMAAAFVEQTGIDALAVAIGQCPRPLPAFTAPGFRASGGLA